MSEKYVTFRSIEHASSQAVDDCRTCVVFTLPKTNIAPENRPSQKETSIPTIHFQVREMLVSGRANVTWIFWTGQTWGVAILHFQTFDPRPWQSKEVQNSMFFLKRHGFLGKDLYLFNQQFQGGLFF